MVASIGDRTTLSVGADEVKQLARSYVGQPDVKDLEFASAAHLLCGPARGALDELPTTAMPWNSPHVLRTVRTWGIINRDSDWSGRKPPLSGRCWKQLPARGLDYLGTYRVSR